MCVQKGFIAQGNAAYQWMGISVAIGDVNGDGIPDLVIGGYGKLAVIFGARSGFPDPLPISTLNGTNGFIFTGQSYTFVVAVGDINGDGYGDIIASNPAHGVIYVIYGGKGQQSGNTAPWPATLTAASLNGTNGFQIYPQSGAQTAAVGDFNHDGYTDIIIGMPNYGATYAEGFVNYTNGTTNPSNGQYITLNGTNWTFVTSCTSPCYTAKQTQIQASWTLTKAQLITDLTACVTNSCDANIDVASYVSSGNELAVTSTVAGVGSSGPPATGNFYTISGGTTVFTTSGATLTGGVGTTSTNNEGATDVIFGAPDVGGVHKMKDGTTSWASSQTLTSGTAPLNGTDGVEFDGATGGHRIRHLGSDRRRQWRRHPRSTHRRSGCFTQWGQLCGSVYVIFGTTTPWTTPQTLNSALFNSGAAGFELDGGTSAASGY